MKNNQLSESQEKVLEEKVSIKRMIIEMMSIIKELKNSDRQKLKNHTHPKFKEFLAPIIERLGEGKIPSIMKININCVLKNNESVNFTIDKNLKFKMSLPDSAQIHDVTTSVTETLRIKNVLSKNPSATLASTILIIYQILKDAILPDLPKELSLEELHQSIMSYIESHHDQLENNTEYTQICMYLHRATLLFIFYDKTNFLEENNDLNFVDFINTERLASYTLVSEFIKNYQDKNPQYNDFLEILSQGSEQDIVSILDNLALDDNQLREFRIWAYIEAILQLDQAIELMIQLSLFDQNKFLIEGKPVITEDHPLLNNRLLLRKLNGKKLNQAGNERKSQIYADYQAFLREHFMADEHKHKFKSVYDAANHLYPQYKDKLISYMQEHMEKNSHNTCLQQDHLYEYIEDFIKQDDQLKKHLIAQDIEKQ